MSWKFWKKQEPAAPQTFDEFDWPTTAGGSLALLVGMYMQRIAPFASWKMPGAKVPAALDPVLSCSAWGYQLSLWFVILAKNHGQDAANLTKDAFLKMLGVANPELEAQTSSLIDFSYQGMAAFSGNNYTMNVGGQEIEMPMSYFLAGYFLTKTRGSPYLHQDPDPQILLEFAQCLDYANQAALKVFLPMHAAISTFSTQDFPKFSEAV